MVVESSTNLKSPSRRHMRSFCQNILRDSCWNGPSIEGKLIVNNDLSWRYNYWFQTAVVPSCQTQESGSVCCSWSAWSLLLFRLLFLGRWRIWSIQLQCKNTLPRTRHREIWKSQVRTQDHAFFWVREEHDQNELWRQVASEVRCIWLRTGTHSQSYEELFHHLGFFRSGDPHWQPNSLLFSSLMGAKGWSYYPRQLQTLRLPNPVQHGQWRAKSDVEWEWSSTRTGHLNLEADHWRLWRGEVWEELWVVQEWALLHVWSGDWHLFLCDRRKQQPRRRAKRRLASDQRLLQRNVHEDGTSQARREIRLLRGSDRAKNRSKSSQRTHTRPPYGSQEAMISLGRLLQVHDSAINHSCHPSCNQLWGFAPSL